MPSEEIVRQQYLIPARLVRKVRMLSKRQNVFTTEIVRRALDAYTEPKPGTACNDELTERLLPDAFGMIEQLTETLGGLNREVNAVQRRIDSGEIRRQAEREMQQWLEANPSAVAEFHRHISLEC